MHIKRLLSDETDDSELDQIDGLGVNTDTDEIDESQIEPSWGTDPMEILMAKEEREAKEHA